MHNWFGFRSDSCNTFSKVSVTVVPFLTFKAITHAYLLKISIIYNKKQIHLLNLFINCISARSAPQILSIKDACNFGF